MNKGVHIYFRELANHTEDLDTPPLHTTVVVSDRGPVTHMKIGSRSLTDQKIWSITKMRFPPGFGEFDGMTFTEVFERMPKWIECVTTCWTPECTGLFLDFYKFVHIQLDDPKLRRAHEGRCREYVKTITGELPSYLEKYV